MTDLELAVEWLEAELRNNTPNADHARALLRKLEEPNEEVIRLEREIIVLESTADDDAARVVELEREVAELEERVDELEATLD